MKKFAALVLALLMVLSVSAVAEENWLYVATEATFPPYEYYANDTDIVGIDYEIADALAKKLGFDGAKMEDMGFDSIIPAVEKGKCHIAMAGLTANADRMKNVYFSFPYTTSTQVVIVKEDGPIQAKEDIENGEDWAVGVQIGTTGYVLATWDFEDTGLGTVESFPSYGFAVQALVADKVDFVLIDAAPAEEFVKANPGLKILETEYAVESYAIAVSQDDTAFLGQVSAALQDLIADGTVDDIIEKYIPADDAE